MKKPIGYITAWTLFWLGHFISFIMSAAPKLYSVYRWSMHKSILIQDWAGNQTPWKHVNNK
jgi:hypothetical protein